MRLPNPPFHRASAVLAGAMAVLLAGCTVGPDYVRPSLETPPAFKETGPWKTAEPRPVDASHPWWELYGDSTLNALIQQANQANQNIRQSEAQYRQAVALTNAARAGYAPVVGVNGGVTRALTNSSGIKLGDAYVLGAQASWEPDIWGSVRRSVEAGEAGAQASAADLAAARLSIQALVAQDYLQLRVTDLLKDLYTRTTEAYARSLALTRSQYAAGVALRSDVALAESQLATAQAQAIDLQAQRSQLEHAIAVLTGQAPASFTLAPEPADPQRLAQLQARLPVIPAGLPSQLLERRPDIAGAERRVAVANANIGVAKSAYFPALTLGASAGYNGPSYAQWFDAPSRVWSLGAALAGTLFDGGLRKARGEQAVAAFDAAVAQYKQTVLGGFQEVEDNLATLRVLDQESAVQDQAVKAAQLAETLALSQYRAGTATYLAVVTAQTLALTNQRTLVQLVGRQLAASVTLIKATGGGWDTSQPVRATSSPAQATAQATNAKS